MNKIKIGDKVMVINESCVDCWKMGEVINFVKGEYIVDLGGYTHSYGESELSLLEFKYQNNLKITKVKTTLEMGGMKTEITYEPEKEKITKKVCDEFYVGDEPKMPATLYKDDNHFIGRRQSGKSTWLINKLVRDWSILVVVPNEDTKKTMLERAVKERDKYIREFNPRALEFSYRMIEEQIMTYREYQTLLQYSRIDGRHYFLVGKKVFIDELNWFMRDYLVDLRNIAGYTLTIDEREKI